MSAARKKGKWVGGCPVLGYDVDPAGGRLVVNEEEAVRVRAIFALFEQRRSVLKTLADIERRGWRLKSWTCKTGELHVGGPFTLSSLRRLLTNILYRGEIRHKGTPYPGEHRAILTPEAWERAQELVSHRTEFARGKARNKHLALLSGLLHCEACGTRMIYTYAVQNGLKYPYYLCLNAQRKGRAVCPAKTLPALTTEESVLARVREERHGIFDSAEWNQMDRTLQVEAIQATVERIGYDGTTRQISIRFHPAAPATGEEARV
jgi:site-specific DNA recombinase